jgi:hypothetical protein
MRLRTRPDRRRRDGGSGRRWRRRRAGANRVAGPRRSL